MNACLESHFPEDVLEGYAMGKLCREESVLVEEHLLICSACQTSLAAAEEYIQVVRAAEAALAHLPPARINAQSAWTLAAAAMVFIAVAPVLVRAAVTLA